MRQLLVILTVISAASAHTIFQEVLVNGKSQGHKVGVRVPNYDGPIYDVGSNDIICNGGPNPLNTPLPSTVINVRAGDAITTVWHHTLDGDRPGDKSDPIDPSHLGPTIAYMAKVDDARTGNVTGLRWFKVYQDGMDSSRQWGISRMYKNRGKITFKIPQCVPNGQYLLRAEVIALHGAQSLKGAQFYMECAQLNVEGGGEASPPTVAFPGAYKQNDPGILFNLYYPTPTKYIVPGPTVFKC